MQCELGFAVNQLLFMQTLFCDLLEKIGLWLLIQNADYYLKNKITEKFEDWFTARYIRDDEALMNLIKISRIALRIKVSLKLLLILNTLIPYLGNASQRQDLETCLFHAYQ